MQRSFAPAMHVIFREQSIHPIKVKYEMMLRVATRYSLVNVGIELSFSCTKFFWNEIDI